jgi:hypothetical protein
VFELLLAVSVHPFQGEGRQMEQPVRPFGFERGEHDGPSTLGPRHRLKTPTDEDRAGVQVNVSP